MPIAFVSSAGATGSNDITISCPAGVTAGHVLVAGIQTNAAALSAPSGWVLVTSITQSSRLFAYVKVAGSSEPASYTWTGGSAEYGAGIAAYSGVDPSTPVRTSGVGSNSFASSSSATVSSPTPVAGDMAVFLAGIDAGTGNGMTSGQGSTAPSGMTERQDRTNAFRAFTLADELLATGGSKTRSNTWAGANAVRAILLCLQEAPTSLAPAGVAAASAPGAPALGAGSLALSPAGLAAASAAGAPTLSPGPSSLSPAGLAAASAAGSPALSPGALALSPDGLLGAAAPGDPALLPGPTPLLPAGLEPASAPGAPALGGAGAALEPAGVGPAAAPGDPALLPGPAPLEAGGAASAGGLGLPALVPGAGPLAPAGATPASAPGAPALAVPPIRGRVRLADVGVVGQRPQLADVSALAPALANVSTPTPPGLTAVTVAE